MKIHQDKLKISALTLAVIAALAAMPAYAQNEEADALKRPGNFIGIGIANTSADSAKFGEYNGLNTKGVSLIGDFALRGGDAYGESGGTMRWSLIGEDVGLSSRRLEAGIADQGRWSLKLGYDELRHNLSDTYQTPYSGINGGNSFTLPGFGTTADTTRLTAAQQALFRSFDVSSTRRNTSLSAGLVLNSQWDLKFDFNRLDQSGAKLMGYGSMKVGTALAEWVSILPNPTNYQTDTFNLALNWASDRSHFTTSYYGSFFRDSYDRVTFQTFGGGTSTQTMGAAPSNTFHQLNLAGGFALSPKTKLNANLSYGRNTQNDGFVVDSYMMVRPAAVSSLNGTVLTKHADIKLINQSVKNLTLSAGWKRDERDNTTSSNIYNFYAISGGNIANYPNTPMSYKKDLLELAGDYRIKPGHNFRLAVGQESISRWCDNYAINAGYPAGTNCVTATHSKESKFDALYRLKATDNVDLRFGYTMGKRNTDFDQNAIAAFISTNGGLAGQNGGDFRGFNPYFEASRKQQAGKLSANWQVSDKFALTLGGRFTSDSYDSTYGVQKGNSNSINLDATYAYSETGSVSSYISQQRRSRSMTNQQNGAAVAANATRISVPANSNWTNDLTEDDLTVGVGFKQAGLMKGKLEIGGDLTFSRGRTNYGTQLNYTGTTTGGLTCADPSILSCGNLPEIYSNLIRLKLSGAYVIDKKSKVTLRLIHQRLNTNDYYYNGYQLGLTPTSLLPTNQQPGSYSVNVVSVMYTTEF